MGTDGDGATVDAAEALAGRAAWRQGLSVATATGLYGVSFGALGVTSGLSVWQTCVLSLLIFSGGSQFALIGVLGGGGAAATAISASALLGVRNALYGFQLTHLLRLRWPIRAVAAQVTIDESTAVAIAQPTLRSRRIGFWVTGLGVYAFWNLATLVGAVAGDAIGDPRRYGLDAAACGAFIALLWPRMKAREPIAVAVVAAVLTAVLVPWLPAGLPVVVAAGVAVVAGLRPRAEEAAA